MRPAATPMGEEIVGMTVEVWSPDHAVRVHASPVNCWFRVKVGSHRSRGGRHSIQHEDGSAESRVLTSENTRAVGGKSLWSSSPPPSSPVPQTSEGGVVALAHDAVCGDEFDGSRERAHDEVGAVLEDGAVVGLPVAVAVPPYGPVVAACTDDAPQPSPDGPVGARHHDSVEGAGGFAARPNRPVEALRTCDGTSSPAVGGADGRSPEARVGKVSGSGSTDDRLFLLLGRAEAAGARSAAAFAEATAVLLPKSTPSFAVGTPLSSVGVGGEVGAGGSRPRARATGGVPSSAAVPDGDRGHHVRDAAAADGPAGTAEGSSVTAEALASTRGAKRRRPAEAGDSGATAAEGEAPVSLSGGRKRPRRESAKEKGPVYQVEDIRERQLIRASRVRTSVNAHRSFVARFCRCRDGVGIL